MNAMQPLKVVVCGGGRTGHLNAVLFKQVAGVSTSLLTNSAEVIDRYAANGDSMRALLPDGGFLDATLDAVSSDVAALVGDADVIVVTVPAHVRPALLASIAPHLARDKPVYVGAIPGFCGFDWLAETALAGLDNVVIWGMKDVPHTAYDLRPGSSVRMGGAKATLYVGAHAGTGAGRRQLLRQHLQRLYEAPVELLDDYLEITLTPGNPIMHSSVLYGLIGPYGQYFERPLPHMLCWWTECPELGAYFLERSDEDSQRLRLALERRLGIDLASVQPLKQEIVEAYGEQIRDHSTLLTVLRSNRAYEDIHAPLLPVDGGYLIDRGSRAFHEDVAFGLSLLVEMGRRMDVALPHIEEIYRWSVAHMGGLSASALDYFPPAWPHGRDGLRRAEARAQR